MEVKVEYKELLRNLTVGLLLEAFYELIDREDMNIIEIMENKIANTRVEIEEESRITRSFIHD